MLLPPVDKIILQDNPEFASLYKILTTSILNADGTSKQDAAQKEREAIRNVRSVPCALEAFSLLRS